MTGTGPPVLLRAVEVDGAVVDVLLADGSVAAMGPALAPSGEVEVVDGGGAALLPGLHDHHVHLLAMAAREAGLDLDPLPDAATVDAALVDAEVDRSGWVRAAGYDEHRHRPMDRTRLDALVGDTPVRVQHRSGLGWVLSTEALRRVGLRDERSGPDADRPVGVETDAGGALTGWLHRLDGWLGERVPSVAPDLEGVGRSLARVGITGVTDATYALGQARAALLAEACRSGALPQRLVLLGVDDDEEVEGWAARGPAKLLADESLGLDPVALAAAVAAHHRRGRPVAIHAVTRAENVAAVTALVQAGPLPGDRIEHGSVLPTDLDPPLAAGGVTVVVQPALVAERGEHHLREVEPDDLPFLHRHASLLAAGVRVGVGSDAPVTGADPWAGITAASTRRTRRGATVGPDEAVTPGAALDRYLADPLDPGGPARRIGPGAPADVCLLDAPLRAALAAPSSDRVRATWVAGRLVHP